MPRLTKLLLDNEQVITVTRTHVKALLAPFLVAVVVMVVAGFSYGYVGDTTGVRPAVVIVALVLLVWLVVVPFLTWLNWTYTLTNKRMIEQRGILTRTGRIIPLSRVNDVAYEKSLLDRILGCGTLVIHDASQQEGLSMRDIPRIEQFHREISQLVLASHDAEEGPRAESV